MAKAHRFIFFSLFALAPSFLTARVISYAPYTNRPALPVIQNRMNRHFVLLESSSAQTFGYAVWSEVVLYDSTGQEEPRVVYPAAGTFENIVSAAVREEAGAPATILVATYGTQYYGSVIWKLTIDGGATWKTLALPTTYFDYPSAASPDLGGPFARARNSNIRIGTPDVPFVISLGSYSSTNANPLYAIRADGSVKKWTMTGRLIGSNKEGDRFLVSSGTDIYSIDPEGTSNKLGGLGLSNSQLEGWLTPDGAAYVNLAGACCTADRLWYLKNGILQELLVGSDPRFGGSSTGTRFFEIPTADFSGAWIIKRATGQPTRLLRHDAQTGLVQQWQDITAPEVEAIHASAGGDKLLIQVHRPRAAIDTLSFKDPALAVWHAGDPAPRFYDELFLDEKSNKGFVHLDVDAIERNEPFVFDGGSLVLIPGGVNTSPASGGSDVFQEWGVIRGSLAQKLVIPGFGRTGGAFNSSWTSDITFYNPNETAIKATLHFVPGGAQTNTNLGDQTLDLAPREIRLVHDALKTLFNIDEGVGALFITPAAGASLNATARTYSRTDSGTFGYGMEAIDTYAAASARFPITFCGAFQGQGFRTNVVLTDVSGRGTAATFSAGGITGAMSISTAAVEAPALGYTQTNGLQSWLTLASSRGGLTLQPSRGEAVASVFTIDNTTNDPTYFPPDLAASVTRTIPAIGHLDGVNGSKFRSDVYLYNNATTSKYVTLAMKMWDSSASSAVTILMQANEARVLSDILFSFFGRTGIARLRVTASGATTDTSIRVSSRTYTVDANGGTYGFLLPPLNSFQTASAGDILEILGPALDPGFRTNLGLVDMAAFASTPARARVEVISSAGFTLDRFEITLPTLGGMQLNDLFRAHQLTHDGSPVLIRITNISGMFGSYAATLDNGTNDSTYFAANLAAK
ncbi:MAG: hypothetical protein QOK37_1185 [Thermoanaerobaculia bacterium]|jgi:hypothetical protein|nr:hypothetical protein [Thermoanaerobaculia bacterium]